MKWGSEPPTWGHVMEAETFDNTLTGFQRRVPFQPFTVVLVSGDRFEVDRPNAVLIRDGAGVYIGPSGVMWIFDHQGVSQVIGDLMNQSAE